MCSGMHVIQCGSYLTMRWPGCFLTDMHIPSPPYSGSREWISYEWIQQQPSDSDIYHTNRRGKSQTVIMIEQKTIEKMNIAQGSASVQRKGISIMFTWNIYLHWF